MLKWAADNEESQGDTNEEIRRGRAVPRHDFFNLTPEERQKYGSINEQNKLLVNKVNDIHNSLPQFDSAQVDWAAFIDDFLIRSILEKIIGRLKSIVEQMDDTKILHDNDNYQQSLTQYAYVSYLAEQNEPGITTVKEELSKFFNRTNSGGTPA